jgi:hypothetical protein
MARFEAADPQALKAKSATAATRANAVNFMIDSNEREQRRKANAGVTKPGAELVSVA